MQEMVLPRDSLGIGHGDRGCRGRNSTPPALLAPLVCMHGGVVQGVRKCARLLGGDGLTNWSCVRNLTVDYRSWSASSTAAIWVSKSFGAGQAW